MAVKSASTQAAGHLAIGSAIRAAALRGEPALVAFLTAGFPRRERFRADLARVAAAADVVEIGVPFTDPMADGMTIQRASHAALAQGVSLTWILEELTALTPRPEAPLLLMSYLNPLLAYGLDKLPGAARAAGVTICTRPMPAPASASLSSALSSNGKSGTITPATPAARAAAGRRSSPKASSGFR